jgi:hypothetical protein
MENRLQKQKEKMRNARLATRDDLTEEQRRNGEATGDPISADQPQPPTKKETFGEACLRMGKEMGALEFTPLEFKQELEKQLDLFVEVFHQVSDITGEEPDGNLKGFLAVQLNVLKSMTQHLSSVLQPVEEEKK